MYAIIHSNINVLLNGQQQELRYRIKLREIPVTANRVIDGGFRNSPILCKAQKTLPEKEG